LLLLMLTIDGYVVTYLMAFWQCNDQDSHRGAVDLERHRHHMADQALDGQLELQSAFREHNSRLQGIYKSRQRTEQDLHRRCAQSMAARAKFCVLHCRVLMLLALC
jgi:hypothetical protein